MKPFIIRKQNSCGHYSIFKVIDLSNLSPEELFYYYDNFGENSVFYDFIIIEIAHLETFGDILVFLNVRTTVNG